MLWLKNLWGRMRPARLLLVHPDDSLPPLLPRRDVIVARDRDEDWAFGMHFPCGCGAVLELMLLPEVRSHWRLSVDRQGRPTPFPSVWRDLGSSLGAPKLHLAFRRSCACCPSPGNLRGGRWSIA